MKMTREKRPGRRTKATEVLPPTPVESSLAFNPEVEVGRYWPAIQKELSERAFNGSWASLAAYAVTVFPERKSELGLEEVKEALFKNLHFMLEQNKGSSVFSEIDRQLKFVYAMHILYPDTRQILESEEEVEVAFSGGEPEEDDWGAPTRSVFDSISLLSILVQRVIDNEKNQSGSFLFRLRKIVALMEPEQRRKLLTPQRLAFLKQWLDNAQQFSRLHPENTAHILASIRLCYPDHFSDLAPKHSTIQVMVKALHKTEKIDHTMGLAEDIKIITWPEVSLDEEGQIVFGPVGSLGTPTPLPPRLVA